MSSELATLATEIDHEIERGDEHGLQALQHYRVAGERLLKAKASVPHGSWSDWLAANVKRASERSAQRYMHLAKRWPELEAKAPGMADMSLTAAEALLAKPKPALEAGDTLTLDELAKKANAAHHRAEEAWNEAGLAGTFDEHLDSILATVEGARVDEERRTWPTEADVDAFYGVLASLREIRDQKLYRGTHATFEDYVRDRWNIPKELLDLVELDPAHPSDEQRYLTWKKLHERRERGPAPSITPAQYNRFRVMPDLHGVAYDRLKAFIRHYGIQHPLTLDEDGNILDGHQRYRAWQELTRDGLEVPLPTTTREGLTEAEKYHHVFVANILRLNITDEDYDVMIDSWFAALEAVEELGDEAARVMPDLAATRFWFLANAVRRHLSPSEMVDACERFYPYLSPEGEASARRTAERIEAELEEHPDALPWTRKFDDPRIFLDVFRQAAETPA